MGHYTAKYINSDIPIRILEFLDELDKEYPAMTAEMVDFLLEANEDLKAQLEDSTIEIAGLQYDNEQLEGDIEDLKLEISRLERDIDHLENEISNLRENSLNQTHPALI